MESFVTNDGVRVRYVDTGAGGDAEGREKPWLVLIHGFTGSSRVWQRNIPAFTASYRVVAPDLRGHGASDKPDHGFQVSRLAMDLRELVCHLEKTATGEGEGDGEGGQGHGGVKREWKAIGGSLGCSILWCYASLFTTSPFTHTIFVDQSPLQNASPDWDSRFCNRGINSAAALAALQNTLAMSPQTAHLATIDACLAYRAFPRPPDAASGVGRVEGGRVWVADERFFLAAAMEGKPIWLGRLMGDHTALDWRASIAATFGPRSGSQTKVLVVASERSGCFPAAGPLFVVGLVGGGERAKGVSVSWGGHWCFWEDPDKFNSLCLGFLGNGEGAGDEGVGRWV